MMRLIFIPGFGETPQIVDRIAPHLPGEKLFIDNLDLLGTKPTPAITALQYAQRLIEEHSITGNDVVIGHSMGGWIAYALKHLTDCSIVQIASWTDQRKVVLPIKNHERIYWLIRNGLWLNNFNKKLLLWLGYRGRLSAPIFGEVFQNLMDSPREYVINQLRVILNPLESVITRQPDVRIHSRHDSIIRYPDQPTIQVPGDHFNLYTHPEEVLAPINALLVQRGLSINQVPLPRPLL